MQQKLKFLNETQPENLKEKRCVLRISLNTYSKTQFKKAVALLSRTFEYVDIVLFDIPQRFNLTWQKNIALDAAHQEAILWGDDWLSTYNSSFAIYNNVRLIRADFFLSHPRFSACQELIETLSLNDQNFKKHISHSVADYLKRNRKKNTIQSDSFMEEMSAKLMKEELAILYLIFELNYDFDAFFERSDASCYFYESVLKQKNPLLLQPVLIRVQVHTS